MKSSFECCVAVNVGNNVIVAVLSESDGHVCRGSVMIGGHSQTAASLITAIHKETSAITTSSCCRRSRASAYETSPLYSKYFEELGNYFKPTVVDEESVIMIAGTRHSA